MLRVYARVLVAVFVAIAMAAAVLMPSVGLGVGAAMGSLFLLFGLVVALVMGILGFPFEGRVWEVGLAHGTFGGLTMACAVLLPCDDESAPR